MNKKFSRTLLLTHVTLVTQTGVKQSEPFNIALSGNLSDEQVLSKVNKPSFKEKLNVDKNSVVIPIESSHVKELREMDLETFLEYSTIVEPTEERTSETPVSETSDSETSEIVEG